jgi:hypothetical protein
MLCNSGTGVWIGAVPVMMQTPSHVRAVIARFGCM